MRLKQAVAVFGATLLLGGGPFALGCQSSALTSGKLYIQQKKYDKARVQLELAVEVEPGNAEAHYNLGLICGLQGDYVELAAAYDRAQELSPNFDEEIAKERLRYWKRSFDDGVRAHAGQGADLGTARRHFDTAVRVLPDSLNALRNRSFIDDQLGNVEGAIAGYKHVLEVAPDDTSTAHRMGVIYKEAKRYDEAVDSFEYILQRGEHHGALLNMAETHILAGQDDLATTTWQRALALTPDCFICNYNLGSLYYSSDAYEQAVESYRRSVELQPDDLGARYNLAITHLAMGDRAAAQLLLETLSVDDPDNGIVWHKLGTIYAWQARIPESKAAYEESKAAYERAEALGQ